MSAPVLNISAPGDLDAPVDEESTPWIEDNIGMILVIAAFVFCGLLLLLLCLTKYGGDKEEEEDTLTLPMVKDPDDSEPMEPTERPKPRFEFPEHKSEDDEQSKAESHVTPPPPIDPLQEEIDQAVDHLIKSRLAQEKVSQVTGSPLLLHGKTVIDGHREPDDEQEAFISRAILDPLQPHMLAALSGEWVTSRGLRIEVTMHGVVKAGDGSRARLMMAKDETIVIRDSTKLLRMTDDRVTGPAPESLKWEDGTFWMRTTNNAVRHKTPSAPSGLSPGVRVETLKGRGTILRLYAEGDKIPYWYVRLDGTPHKETLISSLQIRILPWYSQDAVMQLEAHPAIRDFEEFTDKGVKRLVEKTDEEYRMKQHEEQLHAAHRAEVEAQLDDFHKQNYTPSFVIPPSPPRSKSAFTDIGL